MRGKKKRREGIQPRVQQHPHACTHTVVSTDRFGQDECVSHQIDEWCGGVHVVEGIGRLQTAVNRVVHDGGRQGVKTQEVGHLPLGILDQSVPSSYQLG